MSFRQNRYINVPVSITVFVKLFLFVSRFLVLGCLGLHLDIAKYEKDICSANLNTEPLT